MMEMAAQRSRRSEACFLYVQTVIVCECTCACVLERERERERERESFKILKSIYTGRCPLSYLSYHVCKL